MKSNKTARIVVVLLFLAIITAVIIAGTFARYTSSVTGSDSTVQVAKWSFAANGFGSSITTEIDTSKLVSGKIAPGVSGQVEATIDLTGCEVGVEYTVTISNIRNKPANLKFVDNNGTELVNVGTQQNPQYRITGSKTYSEIQTLTENSTANPKTALVPVGIKFEWPFEVGENANEIATNNANDTEYASNTATATAQTMLFDITIVGNQMNPATTTP